MKAAKKNTFVSWIVRLSTYPVLGRYWRQIDEHHRLTPLRRIVPFLSGEQGNKKIGEIIQGNKPAMIARFGSEELKTLLKIERIKNLSGMQRLCLQFMRGHHLYSIANFKLFSDNAGFFPVNEVMLIKFHELMKECMGEVDLLASWAKGESFYQENLKQAQICYLDSLEPYFYDAPWSQNLEGKRVVVVHPFAETIYNQYKNRRTMIFANKNVLPVFDLVCIKAVQSSAGNKVEFGTWFDAFEHMFSEISQIEFDVAIIGCGAYGFPLAAKVKRLGKVAIHTGGVTQILFGIKGARWDDQPPFSRLYNEYWVRPSITETPKNSYLVENGCYW
jgi:hypothetical protein